MAKLNEIISRSRATGMKRHYWVIIPENAEEEYAIQHGNWSNPVCEVTAFSDQKINTKYMKGNMPVSIHVLLTKKGKKNAEALARLVVQRCEYFERLLQNTEINADPTSPSCASITLVLNRWDLGLD